MTGEAINIVLVDDHRLFRDGLKLLLGADPRFTVVGEAGSGEEFLAGFCDRGDSAALSSRAASGAADCVAEPNPDSAPTGGKETRETVVFMDIDMPGIGGVETTRQACTRWPGVKIIALSMHREQEFYQPMIEAGARGWLLKDSEFDTVAAATVAVARGGSWFEDSSTTPLFEPPSLARRGNYDREELEALSEREADVLPLVCQGLSNAQIADRLFISKRTVDKHRANIMAKTGCKNTAALVVYAVRRNMIKI